MNRELGLGERVVDLRLGSRQGIGQAPLGGEHTKAAPSQVVGQPQPAVTQLVSRCCEVDYPPIGLSQWLWRRRPSHKPLRNSVGDLLEEVKIRLAILKTTPIEFSKPPARFFQKKLESFTIFENSWHVICREFSLLYGENIIIRIVVLGPKLDKFGQFQLTKIPLYPIG